MSLSLRQKSDLYRELGQLLRAGRPFPAAIQLLMGENHGNCRSLLAGLDGAVRSGKSVGDAFISQEPVVSPLESSVITATDRSGKLDQGCRYLSEYYAQLDQTKKLVVGKLLYPVFILHFGVFVTGLMTIFTAGFLAYLKSTLGLLVLFYCYGATLVILASILIYQGARIPAVDGFLRRIPGIGKARRAFALSRFCATYEMQLQSGVNVIDSLISAGKASQSALVKEVVNRAVPEIRKGSQVGPLLSGSSAFTKDMVRAIKIGEETGHLDEELKRLAESFHQESSQRLEFLTGAFIKALYVLLLGFIGYRIVMMYLGYIDTAMKAVDF